MTVLVTENIENITIKIEIWNEPEWLQYPYNLIRNVYTKNEMPTGVNVWFWRLKHLCQPNIDCDYLN